MPSFKFARQRLNRFLCSYMQLNIASLNSGSNGNCYYISNGTDAVMIDAGLSCRETEKRMRQLRLDMQSVKAIFISHEHTDHIRGLAGITDKYDIPVYITPGTLKRSGLQLKKDLVFTFESETSLLINGLSIIPYRKMHDAADPHSFIIEHNGVTVGVFTDIGTPCAKTAQYFSRCHAAFLEANYDEEMLENGHYPIYLKNRIRGGEGHLSNREALELFLNHRPPFMSHLLLSHLSKENNDPAMVLDLFTKHAGDTSVIVASRYEASGIYSVSAGFTGNEISIERKINRKPIQLGLF